MLDNKFTSLFPAGATPREDVVLDWDDSDDIVDDTYIQSLTVEAEQYANTTAPAQHLPSTAFAQMVDQALSAPTALDAARIWISLGIGVVGVDQFKHPVNKQRYGASDAPMTTAEQVTRAWTEQAPTEDHPGMGIAIVPGGSRLLIIDVDNDYETSWLQTWGGARDLYFDGMTVETPGVAGKEGHTGGGHLYLVMPDGWADGYILPKKKDIWDDQGCISDDSFDDPAHFMISAFGQYNLTPPTVREGRPYRHTGSPLVVSEDLAQTLLGVLDQTAEIAQREAAAAKYAQEKADRLARREAEGDAYVPGLADRIQDWEDMTTWEDILTPEAGFTYEYADGHCKVYKWAGSNGRRSVVAHSGCEHLGGSVLAAVHSESLQGHLRSVLPADHQPASGSRGFNMAQMCCAMQYDGDWDGFLRGEGIHRDLSGATGVSLADSIQAVTEALYGTETPNSTMSTPDAAQTATEAPGPVAGRLVHDPGNPFEADDARRAEEARQAALLEEQQKQAETQLSPLMRWGLANPDQAKYVDEGMASTSFTRMASDKAAKEAFSQIKVEPLMPEDYQTTWGSDEDLANFLFEANPQPAYLNAFYAGRSHIIAGPGGCGKTWLALQVCATACNPFTGGRAVYLDADGNGAARLGQRALALGIPLEMMRDQRFSVVTPALVAHKQKVSPATALQRMIEGWIADPPEVLIVDSLTRIVSMFGLNSNSNDDIAQVIDLFEVLHDMEKTCIIFIDHTGHMAGDRPAGSHFKVGAVDAVLTLKPSKPNVEKYPGTTTSANITLTKDRDFGITECLCSPEDDKQAGLYAVREVLDADGKNVMIPVVGDRSIKKVEVNVIPQRLIDNKAAREAAEEAETQSAGDLRDFANLLATRGPLNRAKAVEALREATGMTKRRAEEAVTASRKDPRFSVEKSVSVSGSPLMFRLA